MLLPLARGEALWIAVTVSSGMSVNGRAGRERLRVVPIGEAHKGEMLLAADAVLSADRPRPLDALTFAAADTKEKLKRDHLTIEVKEKTGRVAGRLGIVLGTPALYELLSGRAAPPVTSEEDAYRGWRLP